MAFPYSSGEVLTAANLNASSGMVLINTTAIGSGVSSVTVTDVFNSTFDNYHVKISNCVSSTAVRLYLQFGVSGTMSTTGYYGGAGYINIGAASWQLSVVNNLSYGYCGGTTSQIAVADFAVNGPYVAQPTTAHGSYSLLDYGQIGHCWTYHSSTTQMTDFKIYPSSGTISGGTIRVYGYNNG